MVRLEELLRLELQGARIVLRNYFCEQAKELQQLHTNMQISSTLRPKILCLEVKLKGSERSGLPGALIT